MKQQQCSFLAVGLLVLLLLQPSAGWAFHTWKRAQLSNGLTLLVVEKPDTPAIALTFLVKRGTISEPTEKKGVAPLAARLLTEETRQWSADQITKRMAALGRELAVEVSFDDTTIDWAVLKQDLAPALAVLAEVVQQPVFPQPAVERERRAALAELQAQTQEASEALLLRHVFGTSPYGVSALGGTASLKHIDRQDVVQFHHQAYRPEETILAAAGDVTLAEFEALAKKYFGNWTPPEKVEESAPSLSVREEPTALIVNQPLVQASVRLAFVGTPETDPDTPALMLLARVLAGSPESRLGRTLREQKGWTYSTWSEVESFRQASLFFVGMSVPYEFVLPALHETVREIVRLQTESVSAAELEREKQELITRFYFFEAESIQDLSRFVAKQEALAPGHGPPDRVLEALRRVTAADVERVTRRYLDPQKTVVTVVGDRQTLGKFAPALAAGKLPQWLPPSGGREQQADTPSIWMAPGKTREGKQKGEIREQKASQLRSPAVVSLVARCSSWTGPLLSFFQPRSQVNCRVQRNTPMLSPRHCSESREPCALRTGRSSAPVQESRWAPSQAHGEHQFDYGQALL